MREYQIDHTRAIFTVLACASLLSGVAIFFFVHGGFIRNYGGDVVAITFLYSLAVLLFRPKPMVAATGVLAVAILIEILQAIISLPHSAAVDLTLGSTFDPLDLLVYGATIFLIAVVHTIWKIRNQVRTT